MRKLLIDKDNSLLKMEEEIPSFKLIVMGDPGSGKTSIIHRYIYSKFESSQTPTVGVSNLQTTIKLGKLTINLKIWDTAGQEQYSSLIPMFSRDSNVCLLVADFSKPESISHLDLWIERLHKNGEDPPIIVAINKIDLPGPKSIDTLRSELTSKYENVLFVSAINGTYINELFLSAAKLAIDAKNSKTKNNSGVSIHTTKPSSSCC